MTLVALTGSSRGIGRATALLLARRNVRLALIARESEAQSETEHQLKTLGADVSVVHADLSRPAECQAAARSVIERCGVPDAVVHNAAVIQRAPIVETSDASFDIQLGINLKAPFVLTREWLPAMQQRGRGRLVFVGSISSTLGTARAAAYCASKWALLGFVKSLAEELTDTGLMTVAVLPGSVQTRMLEGSPFRPRMLPEDVATTLVHYALDAPLAHNGGVIEMFGV